MINCMNDLTKGGWGMKRKKLPVGIENFEDSAKRDFIMWIKPV